MAKLTSKDLLKNIEIRHGEYGETFRVRFSFKGKKYTATRDTLAEAITWRDESLATLRRGDTLEGDTPEGDMQLGEATDKYIASASDRARNTISGYHYHQAKLIEYFGEKRLLSQITPLDIHNYIEQRRSSDGVGSSKIYQELSFIRMVYQAANGWGINLASPEINIKRPKRKTATREDKLDRVIKSDELTALLTKAMEYRPTLCYFLIFLLYTGMRPSEAASLRWRRMPIKEERELSNKRMHVGYYDPDRGGFSRVGTKTVPRFVPAHPLVTRIIKTIQEETNGSKKVLPTDKEFIFLPDDHGQRDRPYAYFRQIFQRTRRDTKLAKDEKLRQNIDFYSFRHTARSRMATCGIQDSAAEVIIGHENERMVGTYTHYEDNDLVEIIQQLTYPEITIKF